MTEKELDSIIRRNARGVSQSDGYWKFDVTGVGMACIIDTSHDRMRIIAPIARVPDITSKQKDSMLEANFHSALDVRYATSDGIVYAAFIHPLSPLQESEAVSVIEQVAAAAHTFGTSYSSGDLIFGKPKGKH